MKMQTMISIDNNTLISIGGLAKASDIPAETLRNWERRYGFPAPERLESGHRRYRWDIVPRLRLIRRAVELGYKPSVAVRASESELMAIVNETVEKNARMRLDPLAEQAAEVIAAWLKSVERMDATQLELELRRAWSRFGARDFITRLAVPFLREIGQRWSDRRFSVAHEHFASEVFQELLASHWRPLSSHATGGQVVLATLEGELHALGIHMAAVCLTVRGFEVIFLGPNTPLADIVIAASPPSVLAVVIGLAVSSDPQLSASRLRALRSQLPADHLIAFGGNQGLEQIDSVRHLLSFDELDAWSATLNISS